MRKGTARTANGEQRFVIPTDPERSEGEWRDLLFREKRIPRLRRLRRLRSG